MPESMKRYGLIGRSLVHSHSPDLFRQRFEELGIDHSHKYQAYELADIQELPDLLADPELQGLNVTVPYKEAVLPFCSELSEDARAIGAVNVLSRNTSGWKGHNTDVVGISTALTDLHEEQLKAALILGSGGASKAVACVLGQMGAKVQIVSRRGPFRYADLTAEVLTEYPLIINTTPLGSFPNTTGCPAIPFEHVGPRHFLWDLIYNPDQTLFLKRGLEKGASVMNGMKMLLSQAEASWDIWKKSV